MEIIQKKYKLLWMHSIFLVLESTTAIFSRFSQMTTTESSISMKINQKSRIWFLNWLTSGWLIIFETDFLSTLSLTWSVTIGTSTKTSTLQTEIISFWGCRWRSHTETIQSSATSGVDTFGFTCSASSFQLRQWHSTSSTSQTSSETSTSWRKSSRIRKSQPKTNIKCNWRRSWARTNKILVLDCQIEWLSKIRELGQLKNTSQ